MSRCGTWLQARRNLSGAYCNSLNGRGRNACCHTEPTSRPRCGTAPFLICKCLTYFPNPFDFNSTLQQFALTVQMNAERSTVTDRLNAELANGVVHENDAIFHRHADVPVSPAPLIRPILIAFLLYKHTVRFVTLNLTSLLVTHKTRKVFENCAQKYTLEYAELVI